MPTFLILSSARVLACMGLGMRESSPKIFPMEVSLVPSGTARGRFTRVQHLGDWVKIFLLDVSKYNTPSISGGELMGSLSIDGGGYDRRSITGRGAHASASTGVRAQRRRR